MPVSGLHLLATAADPHHALGGAAAPGAPGWPAWPEQRLHMATGDADTAWRETWCVNEAVSEGREPGLHWRATPDLLFGLIELDEHPGPGQGPRLRALSEQAYGRLFALLQAQGMPHLWRVWNYLADINRDDDGLERYRWFNQGRHDAFRAAGAATEHLVPAASALGCASGPLSIAFMASRTAPCPIENPRQVSAFHYPAQYGPRPPVFARAALAWHGSNELLFVSGTASIVGHESAHPGDVTAQCEETARNIHAVLEAARHRSRRGGFGPEALVHRAYVRHAEHRDAVRAALQHHLGGASLTLLQADVCRTELLVEVESLAIGPVAGA
jgi:enamine deaminase RidA (YjgF/YER057c/UK114 family)